MNQYKKEAVTLPVIFTPAAIKEAAIMLLETIEPLTAACRRGLDEALEPGVLKPGELLLKPGQPQDGFYFVVKGVLRATREPGKKAGTDVFFQRGHIICGGPNLLGIAPLVQEYVQAVDRAALAAISRGNLRVLLKLHPCLQTIAGVLTKQYYELYRHRLRLLGLKKITARILLFDELHPGVIGRVKAHLIADYLGISPAAFSRNRTLR